MILRGDVEFAREVGSHEEQRRLGGRIQVSHCHVDLVAHKPNTFRSVPVEQLEAVGQARTRIRDELYLLPLIQFCEDLSEFGSRLGENQDVGLVFMR